MLYARDFFLIYFMMNNLKYVNEILRYAASKFAQGNKREAHLLPSIQFRPKNNRMYCFPLFTQGLETLSSATLIITLLSRTVCVCLCKNCKA